MVEGGTHRTCVNLPQLIIARIMGGIMQGEAITCGHTVLSVGGALMSHANTMFCVGHVVDPSPWSIGGMGGVCNPTGCARGVGRLV